MKIKFKKEHIIVILIFIIAIFSRIYLWPNTINDVNCDEAMTAINAKAITETGKDMYGTSLPVYFETWLYGGQSALLTYFMALCIKIFGFNIFAIRLPMLIVSIVSIFIFYKLIEIIFNNKKITIITTAILAINPWHIMQSIWSLDCNMFPHFLLLSIYILTKGLKDGKNGLIYISMLFFGITTYSYGIALYVVPIFLVTYMLISLKYKRIKWKTVVISAFIVILISLPLIIMTIINFFDLPDLTIGKITIQNFEYFTRKSDMIIFSENIPKQLLENIKTLFKLIIINADGLVWNAIPTIGTIYHVSIIFVVFGLIELIRDKNSNKNIIILWLIVSVLIGLLINDVNINRLNVIWYPVIILIGLGIYNILNIIKFDKFCVFILIIIYAFGFTNFNIEFYNSHCETIKNSFTWSRGFCDAVEYVTSLDKNVIIDSQIVKNDKNIIFCLYSLKYNFADYSFLDREILLNYYYKISNNNFINIINKDDKIRVQDFDRNILENHVYVTSKDKIEDVEDKENYEIKIFNNYYMINRGD